VVHCFLEQAVKCESDRPSVEIDAKGSILYAFPIGTLSAYRLSTCALIPPRPEEPVCVQESSCTPRAVLVRIPASASEVDVSFGISLLQARVFTTWGNCSATQPHKTALAYPPAAADAHQL
jgi:hypothetical protein